ncbi:MAG: hypothetical protein IJ640_10335 [Prevotella sp.]|nr:hypothetical protein [Prevotella sp.]
MGKIIYRPQGRAYEYAPWAANIFVGCSNRCEYCYCKRGVLKNAIGMDVPQLKKDFVIEPRSDSPEDIGLAFAIGCNKAVLTFEDELERYRGLIMADGGGLFFTFSSDPCLFKPVDTFSTFMRCALIALGCDENGIRTNDLPPVPVTFLTKRAEWVNNGGVGGHRLLMAGGENLCIGFTLTGRDDLEPYASPNAERIEAMRKCHEKGVHTFASVEPVIDLDRSLEMIKGTLGFCEMYKIGLTSGKRYGKVITESDLVYFVNDVQDLVKKNAPSAKIYWKESIREKVAGLVKFSDNVVDARFNIFAEQNK